MARLGTQKRPAVVRVRTPARAEEILAISNDQGWIVIVGIEPDKAEDVSDFDRLLNPPVPAGDPTRISHNSACPCGSGKRYKRCCGRNTK